MRQQQPSRPGCILTVLVGAVAHASAADLVGVRHDTIPSQLVIIDTHNGALTEIGPVQPSPITGLEFIGSCRALFGVHPFESRIYAIDPGTATDRSIGPRGSLGIVNGNALAYSGVDHVLYCVDINTEALITIDPATGVGTFVATVTGGGSDIEGMAYDAASSILYGLANNEKRLVTIDTVTGESVVVGGSLGSERWKGLAFDAEGGMLYATTTTPGRLYAIDPATASASLIGFLDGGRAKVQGLALVDLFSCNDLDCSGSVDFADLLRLIEHWGPCDSCAQDLDFDGVVAGPDILLLIMSWGPCR